jgi:hypothetical protein
MRKTKTRVPCPPALKALLKTAGGTTMAARYSGLSKSYILALSKGYSVSKPRPETHDAIRAGLKAARAGKTAPPLKEPKPNGHRQPKLHPGNGETPFALVFTDNKVVERLMNVGTAMGGSWVYRRRLAGGHWLVILKLDNKESMTAFRAAADLAGEVVTP